MTNLLVRALPGALLALMLALPMTAFAHGGGVRYSYEKVDLDGTTEWVLVPIGINGLGGKVSATTLKTAFELLRKDKRASYGASTITVTGAPPKAKVTVNIDDKVARYALIVMAETVYTLTELGVDKVSFPGHATGAIGREDIPFASYTLTVPLWKAVGRFDSEFVQVRMPNGDLEPSSSIAKKWKSNDSGLRNAVYEYLKASDSYTVQTVAKLLPSLKIPYTAQVADLLDHKSDGVRTTALEVLAADRDDSAVLSGVAKMLEKEKDAKIARAAAEFLGKSSNSSYSVLEQYYLLKHGSDKEQIAATKALGLNKDKRTVEHLEPLLVDKNEKVAAAAAASLASIGADAAQVKALKNSKVSAAIRLDIARDLSGDRTSGPAIAGLTYVAENGPDHEALDALQGLGKKKDDDARKAIEEFLGSSKEAMRLGALAVLEAGGSADSISAIARAVKAGKNAREMEDGGYRIMLGQSLSSILGKTKDSDPLVQRMAYRAAGERAQKENGGAKAFSALESGVKSRDPLVRGAAARAIGTFANKDAERILKDMVDDKSGPVRADVAHGIGHLKEGVLSAELEKMLDDKDSDVQAEAMLALAKRGEAGPWNKIKALAGSSSAAARAASMTAMAKLVSRDDSQGVNEVVSKLSGAVTDSDLRVREAAIVALGTFGIDKAVTAISLQAGADEERIRIVAIEALANTKNPSAAPVVADRLLDQSHAVREAAILALGRLKAKVALQKHLDNEKDASLKSLTQSTLKKL